LAINVFLASYCEKKRKIQLKQIEKFELQTKKDNEKGKEFSI